MTETNRVILVEDHQMMREGLVAILTADVRVEVIGAVGSLAELELALEPKSLELSVVVADYHLPDGLGTLVPELLERSERACPVLLVSGVERVQVLDEAMHAGCAGFVSKNLSAAELTQAIVTVGAGGSVFPAEAIRRRLAQDQTAVGESLTAREREVLALLAAAKTADQIARQLDISLHTARNHVRSILNKLHASSQLHAVVIAVRSGLVQIPAV